MKRQIPVWKRLGNRWQLMLDGKPAGEITGYPTQAAAKADGMAILRQRAAIADPCVFVQDGVVRDDRGSVCGRVEEDFDAPSR